jgi:hypothetical protein
MTEQEAKEVISKLGSFFPDWIEWYGNLGTFQETRRIYLNGLMTQDVCDCEQVIADWQTGRKNVPPNYERERYIYLLIEGARQLKNKRMAKTEPEPVREMYSEIKQFKEQVKQRRENYKPVAGWLGATYRRFLEKAELVKSGQLSQEEYMKFVNAVVAEEAKKL